MYFCFIIITAFFLDCADSSCPVSLHVVYAIQKNAIAILLKSFFFLFAFSQFDGPILFSLSSRRLICARWFVFCNPLRDFHNRIHFNSKQAACCLPDLRQDEQMQNNQSLPLWLYAIIMKIFLFSCWQTWQMAILTCLFCHYNNVNVSMD